MKKRKALNNIKPYIAGKLKPGAIKLASNENPLGPSPLAIEAIKGSLEQINIYPDPHCVSLKNKLAEKYLLSPEQIIIGNGSDEILLLIAGAYIEAHRSAITGMYTFSEYSFSTNLFGGQIISAEMDNLHYSLDNIYNLIDSTVSVIFLCNPNNPSGTYFSHDELESFLKKIPKNILVVLDEAYYEYTEAEDYPRSIDLLSQYNNLLILRTYSKIYGLAGLRIGYGLGSEQVISDLHMTKEPFNVNSLAQRAAIKALEDIEHVENSKAINHQGKVYLYQEFNAMGLEYWPSEANFIFFRAGMDREIVFQKMMDKGITIRALPVFNDSLRVSIGTMDQNKLFIQYLTEILHK